LSARGWLGRRRKGKPDVSWLARIDGEGRLPGEYRLGSGKGIALARSGGGNVVVAAFSVMGQREGYRDNVLVSRLAPDERLEEGTTIREAINRSSFSYFGELVASGMDDGTYVASAWSGPLPQDLQPVEVARVKSDGRVLWCRTLAETISCGSGGRQYGCEPTLTTLPGGDALVVCALEGRMQIHRLEAAIGNQRST
jgi:hypothetical protein